jgi:hypothetical protein
MFMKRAILAHYVLAVLLALGLFCFSAAVGLMRRVPSVDNPAVAPDYRHGLVFLGLAVVAMTVSTSILINRRGCPEDIAG